MSAQNAKLVTAPLLSRNIEASLFLLTAQAPLICILAGMALSFSSGTMASATGVRSGGAEGTT